MAPDPPAWWLDALHICKADLAAYMDLQVKLLSRAKPVGVREGERYIRRLEAAVRAVLSELGETEEERLERLIRPPAPPRHPRDHRLHLLRDEEQS